MGIKRSAWTGLVALGLGALAWVTVAGQAPGVVPAQVPARGGGQVAATVVLLGRVVDRDTGAPIALARVRVRAGRSPAAAGLIGGSLPGQVALQTGPDGRFVVREAPVPMLTLAAEAPGYLVLAGQPHTVTPGLTVSEVTLRLTRSASISGRVTDDRGEPLVRVPVRAWRRTFNRGAPQWVQVLTASLPVTDDRGQYTFGQLPPGAYLIGTPQTQTSAPVAAQANLFGAVTSGQTEQLLESAMGTAFSDSPLVPAGVRIGDYLVASTAGALPVSASGRWLTMPTTLYPGVQSVSAAQIVSVAAGETRAGVDYSIPMVPTASVRGTLTGAVGTVAGVGLRLRAASDAGIGDTAFDVAHTATRADGTFVMPLVPAGQYVVSVVQAPRLSPAQMMAGLAAGRQAEPTAGPILFAEVPVVVEKDVADLVVTLASGPHVRGRVVVPPGSAGVALEKLRVSVTPIDRSGAEAARVSLASAVVGADGTFDVVAGPPGRYVLAVTGGLPTGWFAREAVWNNRNLVHQAARIEGDDLQGIEILLSNTPAAINGSVAGVGPSTVLAFPEDWRAWVADGMSPGLLRQARAAESGAFTLPAVPPGRYLLVAMDPDALGDLQDPASFEMLARLGTSTTVADGETRTVALRRSEGR